MRQPTVEVFLRDVENHAITVLHSDGLYRHIRFRNPKSGNMWFDITTWPEYLVVSGDMGTWAFSRVKDMFTFFRDEQLRINPSYWSEKLQNGAFNGSRSAKVYDDETFEQQLLGDLDNWDLSELELSEVKTALVEDVFYADGQYERLQAAAEFCHTTESGETVKFDPCELPSGEDYSYHFLWCLYAIVWGIQQWDAVQVVAQ